MRSAAAVSGGGRGAPQNGAPTQHPPFFAPLLGAGCDVVCIGRSEAKLRAVADEVRGVRAGTRVAVIVADLGAAPATWATRVAAELKTATADGGLGVLFNNAGVSYPGPLFLHELEARAPGRA